MTETQEYRNLCHRAREVGDQLRDLDIGDIDLVERLIGFLYGSEDDLDPAPSPDNESARMGRMFRAMLTEDEIEPPAEAEEFGYEEAMDRVEAALGHAFMHRLDELVGERMSDCIDAANAERLELTLAGDDRFRLVLPPGAREETSTMTGEASKPCPCQWWRDQRQRAAHDAMLALEGDFWALAEMAIDLPGYEADHHGPEEIHAFEWADFVAHHSWREPVRMYELAVALTDLWRQGEQVEKLRAPAPGDERL